jgi:hypothetical protein
LFGVELRERLGMLAELPEMFADAFSIIATGCMAPSSSPD